ncbi:aminoglycoside adenylyltransferase [Ktedonosporobacter rubrisoli]|uniref:Aminoglycoside adenylyltransferase n=1 Tax=Ktedonosporobacter rubrisoli TaxID=2509675 RepID=A0A4P6JZ41_KTERU|nr:aminoglycoside adenylyltransferase [Ktedonosporobacter rubrisoli]QBD81138.1 aminoglycoside adenylyltransferase [Ktedonosporobacter rubrisoli]
MTNQFGSWQPWQPEDVARFFSSLTVPWWIAGGWALDLFLGVQTREHEDIDILFLRRDQHEIRALLQGWDVQEAHPELLPGSWPFQEWKRDAPLAASVHDIWCRQHKNAPWALQLMVIDAEQDQWISRRTAQIRGPLSTLGSINEDGIPYLAPEIQLFYKAKGLRPKDEADFARTLPALDGKRREWLAQSLALVHPGHTWLTKLT